jgi:hypothetical protein
MIKTHPKLYKKSNNEICDDSLDDKFNAKYIKKLN